MSINIFFFEFTEKDYNYNLNNIGVIKDRADDIFVYKNNFFIINNNFEKTYINVYTYIKNSSFQLKTKIFFNQHCKIIKYPNGKNLGIFQKNENSEICLSELNKNYKIINSFKIIKIEELFFSFNVSDLIYKKIKSKNKSDNKFIISQKEKHYIFEEEEKPPKRNYYIFRFFYFQVQILN